MKYQIKFTDGTFVEVLAIRVGRSHTWKFQVHGSPDRMVRIKWPDIALSNELIKTVGFLGKCVADIVLLEK